MNVSLRQLRAFVALAQTGSFTDAAARLHVTQSALSGLIKELEAALGVQLVQRSTRRVRLAELGLEFLPLAERLLQDLDGALNTMADLKALRRGRVRVAVPQLMAASVMPQLVANFRQLLPGIDVVLVDCLVEQVLPKLHSGEVDFALGPERTLTPGVDSQRLFELPFGVVFPRGHALGEMASVDWSEALCYPVIALKGEFMHRLQADLRRAGAEVVVTPVQEVAFMTTALAMVAAGLGIAVCLPYADGLVQLHGLQSRPLTPEIRRSFLVLTRQDRPLSPAAQRFADYLRTVFQESVR